VRERVFARALAVSAVTAMGVGGLAGAAHASAVPASTKIAATTTAKVGAVVTGAKPYDFNGDGYPDLALGNPYGKAGTSSAAGFVTIVYGSKTGPNTAKKQVISQDTAGVPGVTEVGDHFGYSLTSLDYDRDGFADLLVGAPDEDTGDGVDAGLETILWGTSGGLTGTSSASLTEPDNAGAAHRFGFSLVVGDFDGDGYNEWVDTSPGDAYFWTFTSSPVGAKVAARSFQPTGHGKPFRGGKQKMGAAAAASLDALIPAVGDVNGDHKADLVLAWQNYKADPKYQYGFDVWADTASATPTAEVSSKVDGLAVGDFNGDGFADIAAGGADDSGRAHSHVTVFNGDATVTLGTSDLISQDTAGVPGTTALGDKFGYSLSAGDVNHDGRADLAVGVPMKTVSGLAQAGEAVLLFGSGTGLTGTGSLALSQETANVAGVAEAGDDLGWSVGLLDITNDGYADVLLGTPRENGTDGAITMLKGGVTVTGTGSVGFGASTLGVSGRTAELGIRIGRTG
jgi:hypothetical protein